MVINVLKFVHQVGHWLRSLFMKLYETHLPSLPQ